MPLKTGRAAEIAPFHVMDVLAEANRLAAAGRDVIHLEAGQPATAAPLPALDAARLALEADRIGYTEALGLPALKRRIAAWYGERYGLSLDPSRVVVTTGSSGAFVLAFLSAFDRGDPVALARPGYPAYRSILAALGMAPVDIPVGAETRFQPTPALLDALPAKPAGLIVASPANPTGTMLDRAELEALVDWCRTHGVRLVSDEIYHGLAYARAETSIAALDPDAIVVNSFSKYFSMTGWRLGWLVLPETLVRPVERLAQNLTISPPTLSQLAALAVFDAVDELEAMKRVYAANRALLLERLPRMGLDRFAPPDGAFYVYLDVSAVTDDSAVLARDLLAETGVATTPGIDFDTVEGHRFLRLAFPATTAQIGEALDRMEQFFTSR